jgi:8-oxo-dGTP pyrophosphatase MutT (NUDIX family)
MHRHGPVETAFRAAGCFLFCRGRLLLVQRAAGKPLPLHWGVPSGKIEPGETARMAVVRELAEEVGLVVQPDAPAEVVSAIVADRGTVFEYVSFHLELASEPKLRLGADEIAKANWVDPNDITGRQVVPFFYNTLNDVLTWRKHGHLPPPSTGEAEAAGIG